MDDALQPEPAGTTPIRGGSRSVIQVLWQRRGLILLGLVVGATLGLLNYSRRPPVYRASAQVLVVKKQAGNALLPGVDPRMAVMEDYVSTHLIVIRSPTIITRAVQKKNLGALPSLQGGNPVATIQAGLMATREVNKDGPAGAGNNIINLSYSGSDPGDVETVLSAVIESYKEFLDETYQNTSESTVGLIRTAADTVTTKLAKKQDEYKEFLDKTKIPLVVGENGVPVHQTKIVEYQKKEAEAREEATRLKKRIEKIEQAITKKEPREVILALAERKYEKGSNASQKANAAAREAALFTLLQQEAELLQFYGEDHPDVIRIRQRIAMVKEHFKKLDQILLEGENGATTDPVQAALQSLRVEHQLAVANQEWYKELLAEQLKTARELEMYYYQDREFREDIKRINDLLDSTRKRLEEINLVRGYGGFDAKAIAPPSPGAKVSPVFWQFILMGSALGLLLGCGGAYLLDLADKSFRTPEEIRRRLGLPIIGHVPFVPTTAEPVTTADGAGNPVELDPGLLAFHRPASPEAEAFRGIRTALYFNTHGQRHKVIQVTSPNMGDGKTTLITNLAVSIAQSGRKVLLIDADLRRPRTHRAFGLAGKVGLAEVIAGTVELDEAVQVTVVPNLSILPCGRRPANPAELLTTPRFEDVLDDVREAFDFVLIDSPPLLAVSDPCIVAPRVDGLMLTIRVSKNGRPAAERARDMLAGLKVNCVGVVVNGVGKHGAMTGYGYDHYHYADEYTAGYAATDHDATAEPHPNRTATTAEPSANGHATHSESRSGS